MQLPAYYVLINEANPADAVLLESNQNSLYNRETQSWTQVESNVIRNLMDCNKYKIHGSFIALSSVKLWFSQFKDVNTFPKTQ